MTSADLDRAYVWHPFTQMRDWNDPAHAPIVIVEGRGAVLKAEDGREYLDGNSSIWTNLHGHRHPEINQAIRDQLDRIAHSSFLGLTNDVAARLAFELVTITGLQNAKVFFLRRWFYRDGGGLEDDPSGPNPARRNQAHDVRFALQRNIMATPSVR